MIQRRLGHTICDHILAKSGLSLALPWDRNDVNWHEHVLPGAVSKERAKCEDEPVLALSAQPRRMPRPITNRERERSNLAGD